MENYSMEDIIKTYHMKPHPEGGYYVELCVSNTEVKRMNGIAVGDIRTAMTSILFLMKDQNDFSAFHRLKSDELWIFNQGQTTITIHSINSDGEYSSHILGDPLIHKESKIHVLINAGTWFASHPSQENAWAMATCVVAPGFVFDDFEMAKRNVLIQQNQEHSDIITRLTRHNG